MATATMGLRRRVTVNNSPTPIQSSASTSNKRSRSENNNSPSQGNLNSMSSRDEPPAKKSRGTSTAKSAEGGQSTKSRAMSKGKNCPATSSALMSLESVSSSSANVHPTTSWPTTSAMPDPVSYAGVTGLNVTGGQAGLCAGNLGMPSPIPYMATSMATFVGNATNLGKSSSVSYLDISNMTSGSLGSNAAGALNSGYMNNMKSVTTAHDVKNCTYTNMTPPTNTSGAFKNSTRSQSALVEQVNLPKKFQNDTMYETYQPWVIKTYGDLAKTKTITIKKYARILRTLRGEEVNSAENSKFRFWVKSKGFHIGQPEGYDAKPADRIIGRHAVTSPGLDPPLYVPTQPPHNKSLNGAEGTVPPGRVFKKVAIVENFFDIIHAVHVDLEGRPGKHAGQKRTYRTITETYAFLPREAVTRFLLGCTECQRRPRTPSPSNLANQSHANGISTSSISTVTTSMSSSLTMTTASTPLSPTSATASSATPLQTSLKIREASHATDKNLFNYRHPKHQKTLIPEKKETRANKEEAKEYKEQRETKENVDVKEQKEDSSREEKVKEEKRETKYKDEKYNPLSITNLLKKEPTFSNSGSATAENLLESRRTPESDRASSRSSASSKWRRMLPEGRTPSPQPSHPLPRPWSPGLDPKNTPIDYSLPITTTYLKHQQRILAEQNKKTPTREEIAIQELRNAATIVETESMENERFSPAAGLIDTNLNLLATIQHLHCQVMLALTERLKPSAIMPTPLALPGPTAFMPTTILGHNPIIGHNPLLAPASIIGHNFLIPATHNHS